MKTLYTKLAALIIVTILCNNIIHAQDFDPLRTRMHLNFLSQRTHNLRLRSDSSILRSSKNAPCIQWQKCIGGKRDDYAQNIIKLADGNFLSCGSTNSHNGDLD